MVKLMMFDTSVQELKYKVLREVARLAFDDRLEEGMLDISNIIVPGPQPTMRCCIYKERAIVNERVKFAMNQGKSSNVIEVLPIACDECPVDGIQVTQACRGCIAHRCMNACPKDAITIVDHKATIDKSKCVECGRCLAACPYSAIVKSERPCVRACKPKAISIDENRCAKIDDEKCVACGACVYQCPFGAISDKSYILDTIDFIKNSEGNSKYNVHAVVAPSISGQFSVPLGQVVSGLKKLGFRSVMEAALGADMVAYKEASELVEKGFLTSSCCPAFVRYIETQFPQMKDKISHNLSPMAEIAKYMKKHEPNCKIVFIGPCTAKKAEAQKDSVKPYIDNVITFEELQALFDSRDIKLAELDNQPLDNASYFGRIFARSGGLADAVAEALKEMEIPENVFKLNAVTCDGIDNCKTALLKAQKGVGGENFIEGMACIDGCIGGPACLTHGPKDKMAVDKYGKEAAEKSILDAINILNL